MLKTINLTLRAIMETGIVLAFGYWGYHLANSAFLKILLMILIPLLVFGFWGMVDFHNFGRYAEPLRLTQELLVTSAAAFVLYLTGRFAFCWIMISISVLHHILVYATGGKLLKH